MFDTDGTGFGTGDGPAGLVDTCRSSSANTNDAVVVVVVVGEVKRDATPCFPASCTTVLQNTTTTAVIAELMPVATIMLERERDR